MITAKTNNKIKGNKGEDMACDYLVKNSYQIVERNYRMNMAEIDIIAYNPIDKYLVFVEVKYRQGLSYGDPLESITAKKRLKITRATEFWLLYNKEYQDYNMRFDAIGILDNYGDIKLEHIRNCFD